MGNRGGIDRAEGGGRRDTIDERVPTPMSPDRSNEDESPSPARKHPEGWYDSIRTGMKPVVIDIGSGYTKAGVGGTSAPECIIPTVLGKSTRSLSAGENEDFLVGNDAISHCDTYRGFFPVQGGKVISIDQVEKILLLTYSKLGIKPEDGPACLISNSCLNVDEERSYERVCSLMFEKLCVPGLYFGNQCVMSLFATGRMEGCVLNVGAGITQSMCISEGYALPRTIIDRDRFGGNDVTQKLCHVFMEGGIPRFVSPKYSTFSTQILANSLKERYGYVSLDYEKEIDLVEKKNIVHELPDGTKIILRDEVFRAPELLFKPCFGGMEYVGLHERVYGSITKCDIDIRDKMYENIVLSGGSSLFEGLEERLKKELHLLKGTKYHQKIKKKSEKEEMEGEDDDDDDEEEKKEDIVICAPKDREISAWKGLSLVSSLSAMSGTWMCKKQFEECGANHIHGKFFL